MSQHDLFEDLDQWISCAGDSRVSPSVWRERDGAKQTSAGSGPSSPESFAKLGPDGVFLKTSQGYCQQTVDGSLEEFSETWPRSGLLSNGTASQLPALAPRISVTESGSYVPTATNQDHNGRGAGSYGRHKGLDNHVKVWPTPMPSDVDGGRTTKGKHRPNETGLRRQILYQTMKKAMDMFPTPTAATYGTGQNGQRGDGTSFKQAGKPSLETMARKNLWPTPTARDCHTDKKLTRGANAVDGGEPLILAVKRRTWPTPTAGDSKSSGSRNLEGSKAHPGVSLTDAVTTGNSRTPRYPTPDAHCYKGGSENQRKSQLNGQLNPEWVALLMGYPKGWVSIHGWKAGRKVRRARSAA